MMCSGLIVDMKLSVEKLGSSRKWKFLGIGVGD